MSLNPHHPVTISMEGQWHKMLAMAMRKLGHEHIVITAADLKAVIDTPCNITAQELADGIHLRLVDDETANRLAREHGGISDPNGN